MNCLRVFEKLTAAYAFRLALREAFIESLEPYALSAIGQG